MTPLQICREAKQLTLEQLSAQLAGTQGSSISSLSRLETKPSSSVNKNLSVALLDIFKNEGLTIEHLMSPETFPDFKAHYTSDCKKNLSPASDTKALTEKEIIINTTQQWFASSNMLATKFSEILYEKLLVDDLVTPEPEAVEDYEKWVSARTRRVSRVIDGSTNFPLEWKNHWIACLPRDFRMTVLTEIMSNTGYLLVPLPMNASLDMNDSRAKLDEISKQFAGVIGNSNPAMDGFYDNRDSRDELQLMQDKLAQLLASVLREMTLIENNTGVQCKLNQIWRNSPLNGKV
jgi:hypothetical protein